MFNGFIFSHTRELNVVKAKTSEPIISQSFQLNRMEFGLLLRFKSVMHLILVLSCPFIIEGRGPYLGGFVKKTQTL